MSWKDWPYWLKGGIVFLFVFLIAIIIQEISIFNGASEVGRLIYLFPFMYSFGWIASPFLGDNQMGDLGFYLMTILSAIVVFIIGSLGGLAYGRIKKNR